MRKAIYIIVTLCGIFAMQAPASAMTPGNCPTFIAHQGDHSVYPAQSLEAQISAIEKGAEWIDMDLRPALDGGLFLMHDGGYVETHTTAYLKAHGVPTLNEIMVGTRSYGVQASVEIKSVKSDTYTRAVAQFKNFGISRVTVTSYSRVTLNNYRKAYPPGKVSLNSVVAQIPSYYRSYGSATISTKIATPSYVASLKRAGIPVWVFTPDTPEEWDAIPDGVDGIYTNNIDGYKAYCESRSAS